MKKWIKNFLKIINMLLFISSIIIPLLISQNIISIYWIFLVLFFSIFIFIEKLLPKYSENKWLKKIYDYSYIGKYKSKSRSFKVVVNNNVMSRLKEKKEIDFEIYEKNNKIFKTQKTLGNTNESNSELKSIYYNNGKIILLFDYSFDDNNYKKSKSPNWHHGKECLEYDVKEKNITYFWYGNEKPSYGELFEIERIK